MGFKLSKTDRFFLLFALLLIVTPAHAQKLFYSDSTLNATLRQYEGVTSFFYDFGADTISLYGGPDTSRLKLFIVAPVDEYGKISGLVRGYHPSKRINFEAEYRNGLVHGKVIVFGTYLIRDTASSATTTNYALDTTEILNYKDGRKDGMQYYYQRGEGAGGPFPLEGFSSILSGLYSNGKREGPWREIREDGNIIYYCYYVKGLKQGIEYDAFDNGQINIYVIYKNGKVIDGIYRYYDYDGNLRSYYIEYKNGVRRLRKWE